jgi:uncharacterized protein YndB with AHSA1/START domain
MRYVVAIDINRPVEEVFRVVATDFADSYPKYCAEAASVHVHPPGALALGTTGTITSTSALKSRSVDFRVTAYEPPRRLSLSSKYQGVSSLGTYSFEATRPDATKLTITDDINASGVRAFALLLAKLIVRARARDDARRLKEMLESG